MTDPQPYEKTSILSKKDIIINNFFGGIAWALGATVGLSFIFTLLGILAKNINFVPIVGSFVSEIINFILANNPNLHK
ncbi:MAG TPA: DUF5665 domain-containing protein [Candidatus Sulfotelmatobacter sp.]|jgi:hypothetical protein|nr:DUF5665 domain-containing protein [Candidatus Sulfotelmatobacter sp.]